jgi:hypothetical protein
MPPKPLSPLEDPSYDPVHKPIDGAVPSVVEKWGPRSQLRWFNRFHDQLRPQPTEYWRRFNCSSIQHKGNCCPSCLDDQWYGYDSWSEEHCCCRGYRES